MILNWCNPDANYTDMERIVGTIYDAGVIRRSDLMFLLGWKRSKTDHQLLLLRQRDMAVSARNYHAETVYMLSETGVRFGHLLCHVESKIITMEAQISHQLGVNDIMLRYIRSHGCDGVRWYSTREASDELWTLRKDKGHSDAEIRSTYIRPDALIRTKNSGIWWVEYDNNTESSRQIRKKFNMYVRNLDTLSESVRRVVWVAPTQERADWLKARWEKGGGDDPRITMKFFKMGDETTMLAGVAKRQTG